MIRAPETPAALDPRRYEALLADARRFDDGGPPAAPEVRDGCAALLHREARLLDLRRFDEWLALFADDGLYWVPHVPGGGDPRREVSLALDDRRRLEDRLARLATGTAWSQVPPSRTCRVLGGLEVWDAGRAGEALVRATLVVHEVRLDVERALPAWAGYRLRREAGEWRIVLKQLNLLAADRGVDPSLVL